MILDVELRPIGCVGDVYLYFIQKFDFWCRNDEGIYQNYEMYHCIIKISILRNNNLEMEKR